MSARSRSVRTIFGTALVASGLACSIFAGTALASSAVPGTAKTSSSITQHRVAMILLDVNASFLAGSPAAVREAAVDYLDALPRDVRVGLIIFDSSWRLELAPLRDRHRLAALITSSGVAGYTSTAIGAAINKAESVLAGTGAASSSRLVVFSDAEMVATTVPAPTVPTDVVAWHFESDDNLAVLDGIATSSGGHVVAPANSAKLAAAFPPLPRPKPSKIYATSPPNAAATTVSAPWHFSWTLIGSVAALVAAMLILIAGVLLEIRTTRRSRQLVSQVEQYGPAHPQAGTGTSQAARTIVGLASRLLRARGTERKLADRLDVAGMTLKPAEWLVLGACAAICLAAVLTVLLGNIFFGVLVGVGVAWLGMRLVLSVRIGRRRLAFSEQLPDILQLVAGSLQSGFSLAQSLDAVVREGTQPAAGEFSRALAETRLGVELPDALDGVAARMDSEDMRWTVMAIRIQSTVGGNLAEILRNTVGTMRERAFLRRHVRALTAEGRLSAYILVALPILVGAYLFYRSPTYMSLLYTTVYGLFMLIGSAVLIVAGALWMRALIKVEV